MADTPNSSDDPLLPWIRSVNEELDALENNPESETRIQTMTKECITKFKDNLQYRNDIRFLKIWLLYGYAVQDLESVFEELEDGQFFHSKSLMYMAYSKFLEARGELKKADCIYRLGISRNAEPLQELKQVHLDFTRRWSDVLNGSKIGSDEPCINSWTSTDISNLLKEILPHMLKCKMDKSGVHGTTTIGICGEDFVMIASDGMLSRRRGQRNPGHYRRTEFDALKIHTVATFCGAYAGAWCHQDIIRDYLENLGESGKITNFSELQTCVKESDAALEFCYIFGGFVQNRRKEYVPEIRRMIKRAENKESTNPHPKVWEPVAKRNSGSFLTDGDGGQFAEKVLRKMPPEDYTRDRALEWLHAAFAFASICHKYTGGLFNYRVITADGISEPVPVAEQILPRMWDDHKTGILEGMATNFDELTPQEKEDWINDLKPTKGHWTHWLDKRCNFGRLQRAKDDGYRSDASDDYRQQCLTLKIKEKKRKLVEDARGDDELGTKMLKRGH